MSCPLILLTNDDGIDSPGLWAAAEALAALGQVWVAAPREQSTSAGRSTPPGSDGRIELRVYPRAGREWTAYAVGGSPAQTVLHALLEILPARPDLVVSGINYGSNVGPGATVSGTIGAALEAAARGIPALAVSLETEMHHELSHSPEVDFSAAAHFTALFARAVLGCRLPADTHLLKIEVPAGANEQTPWEVTRLCLLPYYLPAAPRRAALSEPGKLWYTIQADPSAYPPGTDAHTVLVKRAVAVTPLSLDMTARVSLPDLEALLRGG